MPKCQIRAKLNRHEQSIKDMKSAFIRKEWYDAASSILSSDERLELYDLICGYAFQGSTPAIKHGKVAALWALIRPALDQDAEKYEAKCERNRKNATRSQSQPLAANGYQSLPMATNTNNNSNTNTKSTTFSQSSTGKKEREIFDCMGIILSRGATEPAAECKRMWDYYTALGWKNNKGAPIVSKNSAAAMWRLQCDTVADVSMSRIWWAAFKSVEGADISLWRYWRGMRRDGDTLHVYIQQGSALNELIEGKHQARMLSIMQKVGAEHWVWHVVDAGAAV